MGLVTEPDGFLNDALAGLVVKSIPNLALVTEPDDFLNDALEGGFLVDGGNGTRNFWLLSSSNTPLEDDFEIFGKLRVSVVVVAVAAR